MIHEPEPLDPTEVIDGIPGPLVRIYAVLLGCSSRCMRQIGAARTTNDALRLHLYETALGALTHRMEGVALAWYALNGEDDESDNQLRAAAMRFRDS